MGKLDGKVAIVTGAGRGIGQGIARGLAAEGAAVALAARTAEQLEESVAQIRAAGGQALAVPTDVTDEGQVQALFAQVKERFGRLDIQVNNAGAFDGGPLDQLSLAAWNKVIAVNLTGPFLCTREALRIMKPQGSGRIINIGSISAQRVRPNAAPYGASKHGLWGLTQSTALEGREYGVTCGCLHPGNVRVRRRSSSARETDAEPMMEVDEIAQAAILMASLPPHVNMLEAIVLPMGQLYVGRG
jgi:NAD(P)-dependent dehydrogenase (short-subunit alcohol dehydrogenase family)